MISFIWTYSIIWDEPLPIIPNNGGTETFTLGQCRELSRRGIASQVVTLRMGSDDGRRLAPDVTFTDYATLSDLSDLEDPVMLIAEPLDVPVERPLYAILHNPPYPQLGKRHYRRALANRRLIVNSKAAGRTWSAQLGVPAETFGQMYPFADAHFSQEPVPERQDGPVRVLFASRLGPGKGFYTFLEALHYLNHRDFTFTALMAGETGDAYPLVAPVALAHPLLTTLPAQSREDMAKLLVSQDVLVIPSSAAVWPEPFGILSVEAQHAGCRVVASDNAGLPETDCGGLLLCTSEDPIALARAIRRASRLGRLSQAERERAAARFTVTQSVDQLLALLDAEIPVFRPEVSVRA
jgi:glycosyltransferase involved in cell wall biosynthesis